MLVFPLIYKCSQELISFPPSKANRFFFLLIFLWEHGSTDTLDEFQIIALTLIEVQRKPALTSGTLFRWEKLWPVALSPAESFGHHLFIHKGSLALWNDRILHPVNFPSSHTESPHVSWTQGWESRGVHNYLLGIFHVTNLISSEKHSDTAPPIQLLKVASVALMLGFPALQWPLVSS